MALKNSNGTKSKVIVMETQTYVKMPPHSRCNVNHSTYEIVSCRTIPKKIAEWLLDNKEFENGVNRDLLKRSGIPDTSSWWYNNIEDMIMIKGKSERYYLKKLRQISNTNLSNVYQVACDNYSVICEYYVRIKRIYQSKH